MRTPGQLKLLMIRALADLRRADQGETRNPPIFPTSGGLRFANPPYRCPNARPASAAAAPLRAALVPMVMTYTGMGARYGVIRPFASKAWRKAPAERASTILGAMPPPM